MRNPTTRAEHRTNSRKICAAALGLTAGFCHNRTVKLSIFPLITLTTIFLILPTKTRAEPSAVRVRTEQVNKTDTDKFKKIQKRALNIFVQNGSKEMLDLKVKYFFFGRDIVSHDVVIVEQAEKPIQVKPLGSETVETPSSKATFEELHQDKGKKVPASGIKLVGHAVQVLQADTIVAEIYEPANMKEQIGKALPAPKPEKK